MKSFKLCGNTKEREIERERDREREIRERILIKKTIAGKQRAIKSLSINKWPRNISFQRAETLLLLSSASLLTRH